MFSKSCEYIAAASKSLLATSLLALAARFSSGVRRAPPAARSERWCATAPAALCVCVLFCVESRVVRLSVAALEV